MFVQMFLYDRMFLYAAFDGFLLLACRPPICVITTQLISQSLSSHILCCCWEIYLTLTTSANCCSANSYKSAPTRCAAGTTCSLRNGIAVLPKTPASQARCCQYLSITEPLHHKNQPHFGVFFVPIECCWFLWTLAQTRWNRQMQKNFFNNRVFQLDVYALKNILSSGLTCRLLKVLRLNCLPVVLLHPTLSFEMKKKQQCNRVFVWPSKLYLVRRYMCIVRECMTSMSCPTSNFWNFFPWK